MKLRWKYTEILPAGEITILTGYVLEYSDEHEDWHPVREEESNQPLMMNGMLIDGTDMQMLEHEYEV